MPRKPRRLISLLIMAAVLLLLAAVSGFKFQSIAQPAAKGAPAPGLPIACATCHSMDKEVSAWLESSHEAVACLQCHTEGSAAALRAEITDPDSAMAVHPETGPVCTIPLQTSDQSCLECHSTQMDSLMHDLTPAPLKPTDTLSGTPGQPMPINAMHSLHVEGEPGLSCGQCHLDSVHGGKPGTPERRDAMHTLCQDCHVQQHVVITVPGDVSCAACHVNPAAVAPADHQNAAQWLANHGSNTGSGTCGQCHLSDSAGPHSALSDPKAFVAKTQDACASCHGGVPMPHQSGYLSIHGQIAERSPAGTCQACHTGKPISGAPTGGVPQDCNSCHAGVPMPHPAGFAVNHGQVAMAQPSACAACHSSRNPANPTAVYASSQFCTTCHGGVAMPHPAGFASSHGELALAEPAICAVCHSSKNPTNPGATHASPQFCTSCHNGFSHPANWLPVHGSRANETCATCHTMPGAQGNKNPCATCHTGGPWHPNLWYVSHANVVEQQGKAACMKCHDWVSPSCTKCHRNP